MIHSFQQKIPDNRHEHADGFDEVGNSLTAAGGGHGRAEKIVETENVGDVEIPQARAAKSCNAGVPAEGAITQRATQINGFDAVFFEAPAERGALRVAMRDGSGMARAEAPVRGEDGHL